MKKRIVIDVTDYYQEEGNIYYAINAVANEILNGKKGGFFTNLISGSWRLIDVEAGESIAQPPTQVVNQEPAQNDEDLLRKNLLNFITKKIDSFPEKKCEIFVTLLPIKDKQLFGHIDYSVTGQYKYYDNLTQWWYDLTELPIGELMIIANSLILFGNDK